MLCNIKYKRRLILFIKKEIRKNFMEILMILDNRDIIVMTKTIEEKYNTFIHFIYRPAKSQETEKFWENTEIIFRKKEPNKNKHILIEDLNIQLEKEDSNTGEKIKLPKYFKKILKTNSLDDSYKINNKKVKQSFTFFQIQENNEIRSRLDYALIPHELKNSWHSAKIYSINKKISDDHRPIGVTIRTQITREFINKIKETKQTKMNVKDIEDKTIEKIKEIGNIIFGSIKWKQILQKKRKRN